MGSRFVPVYRDEASLKSLTSAFLAVTKAQPLGSSIGVMTPKAQGGITREQQALFHETSLNPVLLQTAGTVLQ